MTIRAVIFDMGGVLVRTEDRGPRQELAGRLGMSYSELSELIFDSHSARLATVGQITTQDHWTAVRAALGLSDDEWPEVPRGFWGGDVLDTELVDYIRSLRRRYRTALLSNAWDNLRRVVVEDWGIADAFDELVISAEVGVAKPEARIFQIALERLGVAPHEAIFVDDFARNVEAARALGMGVVHFQDPARARQELEAALDQAPGGAER